MRKVRWVEGGRLGGGGSKEEIKGGSKEVSVGVVNGKM